MIDLWTDWIDPATTTNWGLSDVNKTQINNKFTTKWKEYENKFAIAAHSPKTGPQGVVRWRHASLEHLGSLNKHLYSIFSDRSGQAGEISPLIAYKARFHVSDHWINPLSTVCGYFLVLLSHFILDVTQTITTFICHTPENYKIVLLVKELFSYFIILFVNSLQRCIRTDKYGATSYI